MFDYLTLNEFNAKVSEKTLAERVSRFAKLDKYIHWQDSLSVLDQIVVSDDEHFAKIAGRNKFLLSLLVILDHGAFGAAQSNKFSRQVYYY